MKENKEFEEWCNRNNGDSVNYNYNFTEELAKCWNHQQQKIDALNVKISHYSKVLERFCCCPENESIDAECPFCIAIKELGE